jgi:cell division protein ZapA (FtsZ GTPase activity inhibitor)
VKIGGMNYQLLAAENETYIRKVAAQADEMIRRVMQNNPHLTLSMSTVLALVNAVDEQYGLRREQEDALHKQEELMRCREQTWEIKKELLHYQNMCSEYEELLEETTSIEADEVSPKTEITETTEENESTDQNEIKQLEHFQQTMLDDLLS